MRHQNVAFHAKKGAAFFSILFILIFFSSCKKDITAPLQEAQKLSPDIADDCPNGYHWDPILRRCVRNDITATYAGVSITYEVSNQILTFNSINDVNTVLDQLDADYDTYNDNYDNQYPNYTVDQLDSIDAVNNFDEFKKFKDFENLFSGYSSIRKQIENTENAWFDNNMTGLDPDSIDYTFDDAENTIFNTNYSFKINSDVYQLRSDGLYINGVFQAGTGSNIMMPDASGCKSNKKIKAPYQPEGVSDRLFIIKTAVNCIGVTASVKGKVVHKKLKNGKWKRARAELAVDINGDVFSTACIWIDRKSESKPRTGFLKRRQLKAKAWDVGTIWKVNNGELIGSFATPEGYYTTLPLTW